MTSLKICIFTETYYPVVGGGEIQAQLLADSLIARRHEVIILTRRSDKSLQKFEQQGKIPIYRLPPSGSGQLKKWGLILSAFPKLIRLGKRYDILFVSGFRIIGITAVIVSKLLHKKCILKADSQGEMSGDFFRAGLEKQGLSPKFFPFRFFLSLRNVMLKTADAFSVISEEITAELTSAGVPIKKIYQIPNSVDTHRFIPVSREQKYALRNKMALPETSTIVVYTGRLVSYKGLPLLLRVWKEIQNQHRDTRLLLLGSGGLDIHNCEAELRTFVHENGLGRTVRFTVMFEMCLNTYKLRTSLPFPPRMMPSRHLCWKQ
jgi:glycosyltransferase involved in cell wall biosynthesis